MSGDENIVVETAERIFADLADSQSIIHSHSDIWKAPLWQALTGAGLTLAWVPEQHGGSGAGLMEGFDVMRAAGRFAIAIPLAETMLAGWLLSQGGLDVPDAAMTVAPIGPRDRILIDREGRLTGRAGRVPFARDASYIAVVASGEDGWVIALIETAHCRLNERSNLASDPADDVTFSEVLPIAAARAPAGFSLASLLLMGSAVRSQQIAGALESMLTISVRYSTERIAFEKQISKYQAVQHNLAKLGGEVAAAVTAATSAADAIAAESNDGHAVFLEMGMPSSLKLPPRRSVAAKRPTRALPSLTKSTGPSVSPQNTFCIASHCVRWRGEMTLVRKVIGPLNLESSSANRGPTNSGRSWRHAEIKSEQTTMTTALRFDPIRLPQHCQNLRREVRAFLAEEISAGTFDPQVPGSADAKGAKGFSRRVGERGWIGMTWPKRYGGQERSFLERYVVTEEMRVANAPVRPFFVADRQSGPTLIRYASEQIKQDILPRIIRGEISFCIGMSEPGSGSDLFAAKTKASKVDGGWLINGTKIWTSNANVSDYMIGLFRTSQPTKDNRRHGLTSFLVDMKTPGIACNLIGQMSGQKEFNEVVFQDAFIPDDNVLGEIDGAWKQATSELAYERSGPERFLETYAVLTELVRALGPEPDIRAAEGVGRLVAQLHTLRRMSVSVAGMLEAGREPVVEAAIVKDIGTIWEQRLPHKVRDLASFVDPDATNHATLHDCLAFNLKIAPKLTIQGGTTEVLRGIIARGLGLR